MAGWFLIFLTSFLLVISVLRNDPTLKGFGSPKESQILGVNAVMDERIPLLRGYLQAKDSPLASYSAEMVTTADKYQFDWRLLPAIAGKESSFGKKIPWDKEGQKPSNNAWGWGIYGDTVTKFDNYDQAIETVSNGIKKEYLDKGLITASAIMQKYTPSSNGSWAHGVNFFLQALE